MDIVQHDGARRTLREMIHHMATTETVATFSGMVLFPVNQLRRQIDANHY